MACGTSHAYVDPLWGEKLPPPCPQECAILEGCMEPRPNSRLTCQIRLTPELDGLTLHLPGTQT
jgi:2Fe-2S ferredoxin